MDASSVSHRAVPTATEGLPSDEPAHTLLAEAKAALPRKGNIQDLWPCKVCDFLEF